MKDGGPQNDAEIVRQVLDGDIEAFGGLVERYRARLFGLAFHLCNDYDTASDLTQDALVAAYDRLDRLRDPALFGAWAAGILRNKFRNLGRSRAAAGGPAGSVLSLDRLMDAGFDPPAPPPADCLDEAERATVRQCVAALPEKYRGVLLLRCVEELSYKAIAELLGLPVTTVTTRLNTARRQLLQEAKKGGLI